MFVCKVAGRQSPQWESPLNGLYQSREMQVQAGIML